MSESWRDVITYRKAYQHSLSVTCPVRHGTNDSAWRCASITLRRMMNPRSGLWLGTQIIQLSVDVTQRER
jgi:hypothetical protein